MSNWIRAKNWPTFEKIAREVQEIVEYIRTFVEKRETFQRKHA